MIERGQGRLVRRLSTIVTVKDSPASAGPRSFAVGPGRRSLPLIVFYSWLIVSSSSPGNTKHGCHLTTFTFAFDELRQVL